MNTMKKTIAVLLVIFLALPAIFAVTWAVGLTRAFLSPKLLSEVPAEMAARLPNFLNEFLLAVERGEVKVDPASRVWMEAASRVSRRPAELLVETGVHHWINHELRDTLDNLGAVLRGEGSADEVYLDFRPLKEALRHESWLSYFTAVVEQLPACSQADEEKWVGAAWQIKNRNAPRLPDCRPLSAGPELIEQAFLQIREDVIKDIPEREYLIGGPNTGFWPGELSRFVSGLTFILFLFPALFTALAALMAGGGWPGFFRWSGIITLTGGLISLGLAALVDRLFFLGAPTSWVFSELEGTNRYNEFLGDWIHSLLAPAAKTMVAPVISVAQAVCVVGIILFAFSYAFQPAARSETPGRTGE